MIAHLPAESHGHHSGLNHLFYHVINWFGVSDHKVRSPLFSSLILTLALEGGVVLLMFALFIKMGYDASFRHLAVDVGGPKRLYSLVTLSSSVLLTPLAFLAFFTGSACLSLAFPSSSVSFCRLILSPIPGSFS